MTYSSCARSMTGWRGAEGSEGASDCSVAREEECDAAGAAPSDRREEKDDDDECADGCMGEAGAAEGDACVCIGDDNERSDDMCFLRRRLGFLTTIRDGVRSANIDVEGWEGSMMPEFRRRRLFFRDSFPRPPSPWSALSCPDEKPSDTDGDALSSCSDRGRSSARAFLGRPRLAGVLSGHHDFFRSRRRSCSTSSLE